MSPAELSCVYSDPMDRLKEQILDAAGLYYDEDRWHITHSSVTITLEKDLDTIPRHMLIPVPQSSNIIKCNLLDLDCDEAIFDLVLDSR